MNKLKRIVVLAMAGLLSVAAYSQSVDYMSEDRWVDSVFNSLTLEQRIGQLMIVRVPTNNNAKKFKELYRNVSEYYAGGVCFFAGTAPEQLQMTKRLQAMAPVPLFVSIDAEWGLGMRLKDAYSFPRQMMMGALQNDSLVYLIGREIAGQCRKMGIHINFAPCVDINSNPMNPVIGARSFGEDRDNVARKGIMYARALQDNGVMAVAKHFPGHGDTDVDSHLDLPVINHDKAYLDSVELYPFRQMIAAGVDGVMIAHLQVDAYDSRRNRPSSLSHYIVNDLLRKQMNYGGLVFSDGMDMKAITKHYKDGRAELEALRSGIDIILLPDDMPKAVECIAKACNDDSLLIRLVNLKCKKILKAKYRYGLYNMNLDSLSVPAADDYARCEELTYRLAEGSVTVLRNGGFVLPITDVRDKKILSIVVGRDEPTIFTNTVDNYADCEHYYYDCKRGNLDTLIAKSVDYNMLLVSMYGYANPTSKKNYGVSDEVLLMLDSLKCQNSTMVVVGFMSPYGYSRLNDVEGIDAIVLGYQNVDQMQVAAANAVFGGIGFEGRVPVSAGVFSAGLGKATQKTCMPVALPAMVGMDAKTLKGIDSIAEYGIKQRAYPGCRVLVAKDGYVVYNKSFGNYTYDSQSPKVSVETMYDIASVTKIAATTLAVMKLVDAGKVSLDDCLSTYLPYLKHTNKKKITIREALSHYAQLQAFIPFWKDAVGGNYIVKDLEDCRAEDSLNYVAIADGLYVDKDYRLDILKKIADTKLLKEKKYVYSDFGFILLADLVQTVSGVPLDIFMNKHFYGPMGLNNITFNPLQHGFDKLAIAPTENDRHFRYQQLQGTVHDENAALMGGVAGHAGLFATAGDLAALMQLLLDKGVYEGRRYLSDTVVDMFNTRYYAKANNRRALGFDKPFISSKSTHVSPQASQSSFGHSGFTGTLVWVDPEHNLTYIFLSNRVYPDAKENKLSKLNIRTDIQELIYNALNTK